MNEQLHSEAMAVSSANVTEGYKSIWQEWKKTMHMMYKGQGEYKTKIYDYDM
jgi:hypothetical protein